MLLRKIKILLIVVFCLVAIAFCGVVGYDYFTRDVSAPVITSDSEIIEVSVKATPQELCAGMHAFDNIDGDISSRIMVKTVSQLFNATDATVSYLVFDNASNLATYSRTVRYTDYRAPRFELSEPLIFSVGSTISLLDKLSATDLIDGNVTGKIMLTQSQVSNTVPGSYPITVQVTNSLGDSAVLPLTIIVRSQSPTTPSIRLKKNLMYIEAGTTIDYSANLLYAYDPLQGYRDFQDDVIINAENVDTAHPGIYEAHYFYSGKSGETVNIILTIVVE